MAAESKGFIVNDFKPAYRKAEVGKELAERARAAVGMLGNCMTCPRNCRVNRLADALGICQTGRYALVTSAFAHHGEEGCLRGYAGSGTIFFGQCNLRCVFCQNWDISQSHDSGHECNAETIARMMLALQEHGCHNINFVTPSHVVPQVMEAIALAVDNGLNIPIVYNTSAYDALDTIRTLDGLIDIYMPDFKLFSAQACTRYLTAEDYAVHARAAIVEMHRQVGDLHTTPDGVACRGLLIRHLVMPG
ncbi:MAG: radical SAM protein, partial [Planctomycetota bacterium]